MLLIELCSLFSFLADIFVQGFVCNIPADAPVALPSIDQERRDDIDYKGNHHPSAAQLPVRVEVEDQKRCP